MTRLGRLGSSASAMETPDPAEGSGPWSGRLSGPGLLTRECLVTEQKVSGKDYREAQDRQGEFQAASLSRLLRFQYKYPGTPISTIAAPQKASVGRWMMVLSVQAAPTRM